MRSDIHKSHRTGDPFNAIVHGEGVGFLLTSIGWVRFEGWKQVLQSAAAHALLDRP